MCSIIGCASRLALLQLFLPSPRRRWGLLRHFRVTMSSPTESTNARANSIGRAPSPRSAPLKWATRPTSAASAMASHIPASTFRMKSVIHPLDAPPLLTTGDEPGPCGGNHLQVHLGGLPLPPSIINRPRARPTVDGVEAPLVVQRLRPPGETAARGHPHRPPLCEELYPFGLGENGGGKRGGQLPRPRGGQVALGHLFIPPGDVADSLPRGTPALRDRGKHTFGPQQALGPVSGTCGVLFVSTRFSPQSALGRPGRIVPLRDEVDSHEWSAGRFSTAPLEPSPQLPSHSIGKLFYTQQAIQPPGAVELRPVLGSREHPQVFTREPPPHEEAM